jgi:tetratricopeptide (TPR) repeat protein
LHTELLVALRRYESVWGPLNVFPVDEFPNAVTDVSHDYFFDGALSHLENSVHVTARLIDGSSGALIWSPSFDREFERADLVNVQKRLATDIANALREPFGPMADAEVQKLDALPVDSLSPYQCNVLFLAAIDELASSPREAARACLERHDANGTLGATGLGALAYLYQLEYDDGLDFVDAGSATAARAYETAVRAIQADNRDVLARMAMTFAQISRQEFDDARISTEKLIALNPPPAMLAIAALMMTKLGDSAQGMGFYRTAFSQSGRPTASLYIAPTILFLQQGDYSQALEFAQLMDAPDFTMYQVFVAALNAHLDRPDQAEARALDLLQRHPNFSTYGRELIGRWALPHVVTERLVVGLQRAGINIE